MIKQIDLSLLWWPICECFKMKSAPLSLTTKDSSYIFTNFQLFSFSHSLFPHIKVAHTHSHTHFPFFCFFRQKTQTWCVLHACVCVWEREREEEKRERGSKCVCVPSFKKIFESYKVETNPVHCYIGGGGWGMNSKVGVLRGRVNIFPPSSIFPWCYVALKGK